MDDADGMFQFAAASLLELSVRGREARAKLVADLVQLPAQLLAGICSADDLGL